METPTYRLPLPLKALTDIADASEQLFDSDNWFDITIKRDLDGIVTFVLDHPAYRNTFNPDDCEVVKSVRNCDGSVLHYIKTNVFGHTFTTCMHDDSYREWIRRWSE